MPALLGIPWLAGIIGGAVSGLFGWGLQFATKRVAVTVIAVSALVALTTAMFAALEAATNQLALAIPPELSAATGLLLPSNITICITAIGTAHAVRFAYEWNVRLLELKAR
jgi:hypothetical protein